MTSKCLGFRGKRKIHYCNFNQKVWFAPAIFISAPPRRRIMNTIKIYNNPWQFPDGTSRKKLVNNLRDRERQKELKEEISRVIETEKKRGTGKMMRREEYYKMTTASEK